jgi:hypothetical protein
MALAAYSIASIFAVVGLPGPITLPGCRPSGLLILKIARLFLNSFRKDVEGPLTENFVVEWHSRTLLSSVAHIAEHTLFSDCNGRYYSPERIYGTLATLSSIPFSRTPTPPARDVAKSRRIYIWLYHGDRPQAPRSIAGGPGRETALSGWSFSTQRLDKFVAALK